MQNTNVLLHDKYSNTEKKTLNNKTTYTSISSLYKNTIKPFFSINNHQSLQK